jgi:hypothetical protein
MGEQFKYLGMARMHQNSIHEEIEEINVVECLLSFGA